MRPPSSGWYAWICLGVGHASKPHVASQTFITRTARMLIASPDFIVRSRCRSSLHHRFTRSMFNRISLAFLFAAASYGCSAKSDSTTDSAAARADNAAPASNTPPAAAGTTSATPASVTTAADSARIPNELGRIPVVEYHLIDTADGRYARERNRFARDLKLIYDRGYRPVSISQLLDRKIDLPRGLSPVVFVFDDASPSQFRYIERNGK